MKVILSRGKQLTSHTLKSFTLCIHICFFLIVFDITDFQVKTTLWSYSCLLQSDRKPSYRNEENVSIQFDSFQYFEEESDLFMNTTYETHACFFGSSDVIGNVDLVCKLERDKIISFFFF
jgi:hypothetical protein